ncbi:MAG: FtsX-like permease family protein [Spirochaetaceae bacterium]|nr:FtsX-like permease family protein [Spirochaetaceae bacterium]
MLRATVRNLLAHKLRLLLSAVAVVLGVSFVSGSLVFTDTISKTFNDLFSEVTADVTVSPETAFDAGFTGTVTTKSLPASLVDVVSGVDGVEAAVGDVFVEGVQILGEDGEVVGTGGAPGLGVNWTDEEALTALTLVDGDAPRSSDQVAIDSATAEKAGLSLGDQVRLLTPEEPRTAQLVGIFRFGSSGGLAGATLTAFDTETAQSLLAEPDTFSSISIAAADGVSDAVLRDRVREALPAEVVVRTQKQQTEQDAGEIEDGLQFFNIILLVFAGVSLFVGSFMILNTFSMLVAQRTRELALLRALGASRRQVTRSVLGEALVVGLVGGLIGMGAGVLIALGLKAAFAAVGLEIETGALVFRPRTALWSMVIGVGVTLVAAYLPARRASRVAPVAAMRDDTAMPQRSLKWRTVVGIVLAVVGVLTLVGSLSAGGQEAASLVGLGVFVSILSAIVLSPVLSRPVIGALGAVYPRMFGTIGRLARDNAQRNPRRTAATSSALMVGLALVAAFGVLAASINSSIGGLIDRALGSDYVVTAAQQLPFGASVARDIEALPDVESVTRQRFGAAQVDGSTVFIGAADPASLATSIQVDYSAGDAAGLVDGLLVDEPTATSKGVTIGDTVDMVFLGGSTATLPIAGIYQPNGALGQYVVSLDTWEANGGDTRDSFLYVNLKDDVDAADAAPVIERTLKAYPNVDLLDQAGFKDQQRGQVNQLLFLIYALLALAILIAVLGIVNTLALAVIERTREIGLLRAVGMSRRQLRLMVRLESVVISVFGAVLGLGLGVLFGVLLQRSLAGQGISDLAIPWGSLVLFLVVAAVIGVLAAIWPARRAARLDVLRAITTE